MATLLWFYCMVRCLLTIFTKGHYTRCYAKWVQTDGESKMELWLGSEFGYWPLQVVGEAYRDWTEEIQRADLFDIGTNYADIVSETEAIEKDESRVEIGVWAWKCVYNPTTRHLFLRSKNGEIIEISCLFAKTNHTLLQGPWP